MEHGHASGLLVLDQPLRVLDDQLLMDDLPQLVLGRLVQVAVRPGLLLPDPLLDLPRNENNKKGKTKNV